MSEYLFELFVLTVRLYAVMDPMGAVPIFISLTSKKSTEERMKMLKLATGVVVTIVSILSISGSTILEVLGITPPSIKIGGGILLMVLAIDEMRGILRSRMPLEEELAVVPLAIPTPSRTRYHSYDIDAYINNALVYSARSSSNSISTLFSHAPLFRTLA